MTSSRILPLALGFALLAAACGSSDETTTTVPTTTTVAATTTTAAETTPTTSVETTTTTTLAGVPIASGPAAGDVLSVVGIALDNVLNVRVAPGLFNTIVDTIEPTGTAVATGTARDLGLAIWIELDTGDTVGWSNLFFLAYEGATDDATAEVIEALGDVPTDGTMEALGLIVAATQASTELPSRIVLIVEPTFGDLAEVTYDVIGLGDDAVFGYRLRIFGEEVIDGFSLNTVERTALCIRGVDADGLCV